jgi:hypothetical protein
VSILALSYDTYVCLTPREDSSTSHRTAITIMSSSELPTLSIPASDAVIEIRAINGGYINVPPSVFWGPSPPDIKTVSGLALSFFIENKAKGKRVLFDLGISKDRKNYPPELQKGTQIFDFGAVGGKDVADILREGGVQLESIDAVIWRFVWYLDCVLD